MRKINIFIITAVILTLNFISSDIIYSQIFWNEVTNTGVTVSLRSVSNVNAFYAWVCGASGTVIKTTNGGYNWSNVTGNGIPTSLTLINIFAINEIIAFTAGYTGTNTFVFRTTNSGLNWSQVFTESNGFIDALWMSTASNGFMVGDPVGGRWSLWKTTNGGANWDSTGLYLSQVSTEAGWNGSLYLVGSKIWFGTNNSKIYYSPNFGLNWLSYSVSPAINVYSLCFDNAALRGLAGDTALYRTTNSGVNWLPVIVPGSGNINGLTMNRLTPNFAWLTRSNNSIYVSFNPFTDWIVSYTTSSGIYNHIAYSRDSMMYVGPGLIYAVKNNGGITRGNSFIEGVELISNEIPKGFTLHQNYPNPFNPQTKIRLEVPLLKNNKPGEVRGALIKIQVYDVTGKLIEKLLDQITQPGVYEKTWNGSNYSSGVYFYRVIIADPLNNSINYVATRKMVLVK